MRYFAEDRRATLQNIRLLALLAAILVPLFSVVDYYVYPKHFEMFLWLRGISTALVFAIWRLSYHRFGKRYYRLLTIVLPMVPATTIAVMIYLTGDPGSPYYAGLTLCLCGIGFVFHWSFREALFASLTVLVMYLAACMPELVKGASKAALFYCVFNLVFIAATGLVITLGSYAHHKIRINEFLARDELRRSRHALSIKNIELQGLIDELRETERQLIQSEKLASLGQLSAGVIHEIGNPLNYSNQALYLLRKKIGKGSYNDLPDIVDDVQEGCDRIKDIVSNLREFSHDGRGENATFPMSEPIHSALRMLSKELEKRQIEVELDIEKGAELPGVKNQITQLVMNLVLNAIQAIDSSVKSEPGKLHISARVENENAVISIVDNGPGISPEVRDRIFDPFFTTKPPGEGTGLGLSICYRIIEAHGGSLAVESHPGNYTRFTITLPDARSLPAGKCRKIA